MKHPSVHMLIIYIVRFELDKFVWQSGPFSILYCQPEVQCCRVLSCINCLITDPPVCHVFGGAVSCRKAAVWSAVGGGEWLAVPVYGVEQL